MGHAILSPSSSHRWAYCSAAPALEKMFPQETSTYAQEGTDAHANAASLLDPERNPTAPQIPAENMEFVQQYVDFINKETEGGIREIELPVAITSITGEANAKGTIDCAALVGRTLKIIDLKFGRGVQVDAKENSQLSIYACGARDYFSIFGEIENIELIIFQPRIGNISRWSLSADKLKVFENGMRERALKALQTYNADPIPAEAFCPSAAICRFCKAKGACPAVGNSVAEFIPDVARAVPEIAAPEALTTVSPVTAMSTEALAKAYGVVDLVESWCEAVRKRLVDELKDGVAVPGYKLVAGRRGARKWIDEAEVEALLKSMKVKEDERYTKKVISPTQAEKLHKSGVIGDRQWPRLQKLCVQNDGAPVVAPDSDPRPAYAAVSVEDFQKLD